MATIYTHITENKSKTVALIGFFLIFVIGLGWVLSYGYDSPIILVIAVGFSMIQAFISYYWSDSITLALSRAQELPRKESFLELHRLVENLAITAGLPKPKLYLIDDTAPNAFATGRDPQHASVAVTKGLLEKLNKNELQGVLAHELSHVGNYDIRLMTIVVVLVGVVTLLADWFLRSMIWGRGERRERGEGGQIIMLIAIVFAILSPIFATLIQLTVSRKREFLADATGALLTRYPEGLASALQKIAADREPLEVANRATAHLYIANPLKDHEGKSRIGWFAGLFSTHPPVEERVKRLLGMAI